MIMVCTALASHKHNHRHTHRHTHHKVVESTKEHKNTNPASSATIKICASRREDSLKAAFYPKLSFASMSSDKIAHTHEINTS